MNINTFYDNQPSLIRAISLWLPNSGKGIATAFGVATILDDGRLEMPTICPHNANSEQKQRMTNEIIGICSEINADHHKFDIADRSTIAFGIDSPLDQEQVLLFTVLSDDETINQRMLVDSAVNIFDEALCADHFDAEVAWVYGSLLSKTEALIDEEY